MQDENVHEILILADGGRHCGAERISRHSKQIKIGGEGGWDYLTMDSAARRLYVSHATHVVVVDVDAGTSLVKFQTRQAYTESPWPRSWVAASPATAERTTSLFSI